MSAAAIHGLTFSISPAKKKPKSNNQGDDDDDDDYVLTLAPFCKAPKINFGQVKPNTLVERNLLIINPQEFEVILNVTNQDLQINNIQIPIPKMTNVDFKLKWVPEKDGSYKYSIMFEVTNCARLKFLVHAFGICIVPKTTQRKPLTMLQPLKKEKSTHFGISTESNQPPIKTPAGSAAPLSLAVTQLPPTIKNLNEKPALPPAKQIKPVSKSSKENQDQTKKVPIVSASAKTSSISTSTSSSALSSTSASSLSSVTKSTLSSINKKTTKIIKKEKISTMCESKSTLGFRSQTTKSSSISLELNKMTKAPSSIDLYSSFYDDDDENYDDDTKFGNKVLEPSIIQKDLHRFERNDFESPNMNQTYKLSNHHAASSLDLYDVSYKLSDLQKTPQNPMKKSYSAHNLHSPSSSLTFTDLSMISSTILKGNKSQNESNESTSAANVEMETPKPNMPNKISLSDNTNLTKTPTYFLNETTVSSRTIIEHELITTTAINGRAKWTKKPSFSHLYEDASNSEYSIYDNDLNEQRLVKYVMICQKNWRMKQFRRRLRQLKFEKAQKIILETLENARRLEMDDPLELIRLEEEKHMKKIIQCAIKLQRAYRMKQFRRSLQQLKEMNRLNNAVVKLQRAYRMKRFRCSLQQLKEKQKQEEEMNRLNNAVIKMQRAYRMKQFRRSLVQLKEKQKQEEDMNRLINATVKLQRAYRMKRFRRSLQQLKEMNRLNNAAIRIQRWSRGLKLRYEFLLKRRLVLRIQVVCRRYLMKRNQAAICIQCAWRRFVARKLLVKKRDELKRQHAASVRIQSVWRMYKARKELKKRRDELAKKKTAATRIQCFWRMYSACKILIEMKQQKIKIENELKLKRLNQCATRIQSLWKGYVTRKMTQPMIESNKKAKRLVQAAIKIQKWSRSMKLRYEFLLMRRAVCKMQRLYRVVYWRKRHRAATRIQSAWRVYTAKKTLAQLKLEHEENMKKQIEQIRINKYAIRIQSFWRGYMVRKQTDNILNSIRNRLSIYGQTGLTSTERANTLGSRIQNSLKILRFPCVPIQQIVMALTDLDKVTRLSPECCHIFTNEKALEILYAFIANCNRSVPHMDLIKFCLRIFINLAKYNETVIYILEPYNSLLILSNLLQAYQSTNPNIFMEVCVLFILLAQWKPLADLMLSQDGFIKKLQNIYMTLERRACFKLKQNHSMQGKLSSTIVQSSLNSSINLSTSLICGGAVGGAACSNTALSTKKSLIVSFTLTPEWSLKQKTSVDLVEPLGALEYLLNTLQVKIESIINNPTNMNASSLFKTPKKNTGSGASSSSSSSSSVKLESSSSNKKQNVASSSLSASSDIVNTNKQTRIKKSINLSTKK